MPKKKRYWIYFRGRSVKRSGWIRAETLPTRLALLLRCTNAWPGAWRRCWKTDSVSCPYENCNSLCFAADLLGDELIRRIIDAWLLTPFEQGRHSRRVEKLAALERQLFGSDCEALLRNLGMGNPVANNPMANT